ncbi:hypothetical protein SCHPADRAFT_990128 [Schizopora paradoxa]|uniref:Uncharacterized protein n=1 Tax=Schizopora paradoxa TaxID=27342 RepID=A0A0H2QX87_9AGAM|nr:hypothetical protein SCHPADRAFT_990128 [Schizopora paradoxa]
MYIWKFPLVTYAKKYGIRKLPGSEPANPLPTAAPDVLSGHTPSSKFKTVSTYNAHTSSYPASLYASPTFTFTNNTLASSSSSSCSLSYEEGEPGAAPDPLVIPWSLSQGHLQNDNKRPWLPYPSPATEERAPKKMQTAGEGSMGMDAMLPQDMSLHSSETDLSPMCIDPPKDIFPSQPVPMHIPEDSQGSEETEYVLAQK